MLVLRHFFGLLYLFIYVEVKGMAVVRRINLSLVEDAVGTYEQGWSLAAIMLAKQRNSRRGAERIAD